MKKSFTLLCLFLICRFVSAQLTIYANTNLQGTSGTCVVRTIYNELTIPNNLNNNVESISLAQGFMATLAENSDGSGERFTYMANTSVLNVNLPLVLQNKVSFIRVLRLPNFTIRKKGSANTNNLYTQDLNVTWFYDWGFQDFSTPTREFTPMAWGRNHASLTNINRVIQKDSVNHYMAFNEPDHEGQAEMWVAESVPLYKDMLSAGLRMVSPSCTESQFRVWLDSFTTVTESQNLRIDAVGIHWYDWGNWLSTMNANPNATDVFNRFKANVELAYDYFKKPIWITEFNANPNRPASVQTAFMNLALPWLDASPMVERYAYFFGNDVPMYTTPPNGTTPGILTTPGTTYANHTSVNAYPENLYDTRPSTPITLAEWDPSSFTQGGLNVATFAPTGLNTNMTCPTPLTRGSGVDLPFTTSSNGFWGGTDWVVSTSAADGITANKFFRFSLRSKNGKSVNYHAIDKFNIRINGNGPIKYQIDYQLNNGLFFPIATVTGPPRTAGNYVLGPIDLSKIAGLQNVPPTSTITFRITPFDALAANSSFLIGSGTTDTNPDLVITGGFSEANLIILPISLGNFELKRNNNKVLLNWQSTEEINFSHFEVQRGVKETEFASIATVKGANQSNGSKYSYTDELTNSNIYYYRLKMIDKDGSFKYSNILKTSYEANNANFEIYPILTNGSPIVVSIKNPSALAEIKVLSLNGKVMSSFKINQSSSQQFIQTNNLPTGMYIVVLSDKGMVQHKKFVKQ